MKTLVEMIQIQIYDEEALRSNYSHPIDDGTSCNSQIHHGSCCDTARIHDPTEEVPSQIKKRRVDRSTECLLDRLPEAILHDILSRLSICEVLRAQQICVAWHNMVSSSNIFQRLYDSRNQESWIALTDGPQNPFDFCLFNNHSNKSYFFQTMYEADLTNSCWLLQGTADGLMLFVSSEGKMVAANALTRSFQLLPDTKVSTRLGLQSCLKKKLWGSNCTPSMSINIVVDSATKTYKVMVWGEVRSGQVHSLVYSSATDKWSVRLCSEISYGLFRRPFHSTVHGNTIFYTSTHMLTTYDTQTDLFVVKLRNLRMPRRIMDMAVRRVHIITITVYKSQIFILCVVMGWRSSAVMGLWQANLTHGQWELLTSHGLQFYSHRVAAAYDGKHSITIIPRMRGSNIMSLNLDTKEWMVCDGDNQAWRLSDGNAQHRQTVLRFCTP